MWTKIVNFFGFWTKKQIAEQYKGVNIDIVIHGEVTPEKIQTAVQQALAGQTARRKKIADDYLDGNDNWKKDK